MKTMRSTYDKRIFRVTDSEASQLYQDGEANYATKEEWKKEVRDFNKPKETAGVKSKTNKPSKAQKRQMRKTL